MRDYLPTHPFKPLMTADEMKRAARKKPTKGTQTPHEVRVAEMVSQLIRSDNGASNAGILTLILGTLSNDQLKLTEDCIHLLSSAQERYEEAAATFRSNRNPIIFFNGAEEAPFSFIVRAVLGDFDEAALLALRDFRGAHNHLGDLVDLCRAMSKLGIALTDNSVTRQVSAMNLMTKDRIRLGIFDHPYTSHPDLIRAVHNYPERMIELIDLQKSRGSVKAAVEVLSASKAISGGAL